MANRDSKKKKYELSLSKSIKKSFKKTIEKLNAKNNTDSASEVEKAIEGALNMVMENYFDSGGLESVQNYLLGTDGVITINDKHKNGLFAGTVNHRYRILIETKRKLDFSGNKESMAITIAQCMNYLRKFRAKGELVPKAIIIADEDEIFYIPSSVVSGYLDEEYQWDLAPSNMKKDKALIAALVADKNINPYVHDMSTPHFDIERFLNDAFNAVLEDKKLIKIPATTENLSKLFLEFNTEVFDGTFDPVDNQAQLKLFYYGITGDDNVFLHPKKKNVVMVDGDMVQLPSDESAQAYEYFWNHIDTNYTSGELAELVSIFDQGLSDKIRRFHGDFFTPVLWVDKAHEVISSALGDNWKQEYVVVDPACGTKNLTRDYEFSELYSMTLHQEELDVSAAYNKDNVAVQYDFLNDDVLLMHGEPFPVKGGKKAVEEWKKKMPSKEVIKALSDAGALKIPQSLINVLWEKKPIVFFANPPYGQHTDQDGAKKKGIATTAIRELMLKSYGHAKKELYTQFIYRLQLLAQLFDYEEDFHFFFFNKGFLTSPSFGNFTENLANQFTYKNGFMMNAGEFQGTSSAWGIIFSHWEIGGKNQRSFTFDVLQSNKDKTAIEQVGSWEANMVDKGKSIVDWLRETTIHNKIYDGFPRTTNGYNIPPGSTNWGFYSKDAVGFTHQNSNNVQFSEKYTGMYSLAIYAAHAGVPVTQDNIHRAAATFSIRRAVQRDVALHDRLWIQDKDVFRAPSNTLSNDTTFLNDCLVYSLFDSQSSQTSLRDYVYNGNTYNVYNEFFPFSKEEVKKLAISAIKDGGLTSYRDMEDDIARHGKNERLVYTLLEDAKSKGTLSVEAQQVLDNAWELIEHSFSSRGKHQEDRPRYQVMNWDAGWLSIRTLLWGKDRVNDSFLPLKEAWDKKLTVLGDKIAQRAYDDGIIADPAPEKGSEDKGDTAPEESQS